MSEWENFLQGLKEAIGEARSPKGEEILTGFTESQKIDLRWLKQSYNRIEERGNPREQEDRPGEAL